MNSTSSEDIDAAIADAMARKDSAVIKAMIDAGGNQHISAEDQWSMNILKNIRVYIAITGVSGAGKSSFVNALRGLDDDEEHSAKTEVPTLEPTPYPYPPIPNFIIWDLPGTEIPHFEADKYLKQVNFDKYDFFILVCQEPFTDNDIQLVHEIQKMKKKFYYVRTKVVISIDGEQRKMKKNFKEKETLDEIRKACEEDLRKAGEPSSRVFLISRWELDKYDFPHLLKQMERDQDVIRKDALAMLCLRKKKEAMEDYIWKQSLASCARETTPIPRLSFLCDLHSLVVAMNHIRKVFGLNEEFLDIIAKRFGKSVDELKSGIQSCPIAGKINEQMAIDYLKRSEVWGTQTMVELARDSKTKVKPLVAVANSLACTHFMLTNFLDEVMRDAKNVLEKAAEGKSLRFPDLAQTMSSPSSEDIDAAIAEAMESQDIGAIKAMVAGKNLQPQQEMGLLKNVRVNIAVTGTSCVGKLSLINVLLDVDDDDERAAKTGITETTTVPTPYCNPLFPNLILWDLPGIRTPDFKPDTYPEQANFDKYDLFIIVVSECFTENDERVAREIKKTKKKIYNVITKGDIYKDYKQEKKDFQKNYRKTKKPSPGVSQTCTWIFFHYAFPSLIEEMKQDILEMFLPGLTNGGLRQKKEAMENYIWKQSIAASATGRTPIPGLSLAYDIGILVATMKHVCQVFGLDEESFRIVAERFGKSDGKLKSAIQSCPTAGEVNAEMVTKLLESSEIWERRTLRELASDYTQKISKVFLQLRSFVSTFHMLKNFLKDVVRGAEIVLAKAAE